MSNTTAILPLQPTSPSNSPQNPMKRFGEWVLKVPPITDVLKKRQARMLALVTFTIGVIAASLISFFVLSVRSTSPLFVFAYTFPLLLLGSFIFNRYGFYRAASIGVLATFPVLMIGLTFLFVGALPPSSSLNTINDGLLMSQVFAAIGGIILASIFLSLRGVIIFTIINFVISHLLVRILLTGSNVTVYVIWYILICSLVFTFMWFRSAVERDRQKELADALQRTERSNEELKHVNTELIRAKAVAQESTRLKSEFLNTMSHELRTPLNAITGYTGIMLSGMGGEFDDETGYMLERIEDNSTRLLTLINDVLDIAKIEAGRMTVVTERVAVRELVDRWTAGVEVLAQNKGLNFAVEIDPALPDALYTDTQRTTQIVTNLLSNAVKFTEKGTVTLSLVRQADQWQIHVKDTGIGIPPHALNYIFEAFRQIDGSTQRVYGGTGLGLAIVRNLCRLLDGNITVQSELEKGSIFTVSLPLITAAPSDDTMPTQHLASTASFA